MNLSSSKEAKPRESKRKLLAHIIYWNRIQLICLRTNSAGFPFVQGNETTGIEHRFICLHQEKRNLLEQIQLDLPSSKETNPTGRQITMDFYSPKEAKRTGTQILLEYKFSWTSLHPMKQFCIPSRFRFTKRSQHLSLGQFTINLLQILLSHFILTTIAGLSPYFHFVINYYLKNNKKVFFFLFSVFSHAFSCQFLLIISCQV